MNTPDNNKGNNFNKKDYMSQRVAIFAIVVASIIGCVCTTIGFSMYGLMHGNNVSATSRTTSSSSTQTQDICDTTLTVVASVN